jgi:hypothetical protein
MFPKTKLVNVRKVLERLYVGTCTITEHQKVKKENKSTGFVETVVLRDQPCRLSFKTINQTNMSDTGASAVTQITQVFLAPEIKVKPGSKLTITQNGVTTEYKSSGEPAVHANHQEIQLTLFKGWA